MSQRQGDENQDRSPLAHSPLVTHSPLPARHVLVYDIGGGTLDVSALYMNGKAAE